ncbi:TauD/TfdA dioxygenase family protein [Falsiroseomonas selenitidurans]|uniref:TauD/TfdA family dioxygenase n=1 Tax=Falsiroseomonas selenitidurans TaxID=2716335 RepID=A0ABX1E3N3_9PROT|nr:TauD/TfdA family dioxygenase [Falsiroseomonas selenitidurans]NKC30127.1 TauD/TfdA family dioxygenase [Falsiroseomonas selenitidurans]
MAASLMAWRSAAARRGLAVRELGPNIGVEIGGLDLAAPEDAEITAILRGAVVERTLLLVRGQQHLTPAGYVGFARRFGDRLDLHSRRDLCLPDHHEIFVVGNVVENGKPAGAAKVGLNWHTDHYHLEHPALFTFLHALEVPPVAGHTRYANGIAAWEALDEETRQKASGLGVLHSRARLYRELFPDATEEQCQAEAARFPDVVHPLVRTHPESGRRGLYLGGEWGSEIQGLPKPEADALFARLLAQITRPDFVHEHHWQPGDVLMSDNRCSLHRASEWDEGLYRRRLHRLILLDTVRPVG